MLNVYGLAIKLVYHIEQLQDPKPEPKPESTHEVVESKFIVVLDSNEPEVKKRGRPKKQQQTTERVGGAVEKKRGRPKKKI